MYLRDYHNPAELRASVQPIGGTKQLAQLFNQRTDAGMNVNETTAMNIAALFRAVTILAQSQAQIVVEVIQDKRTSFTSKPDHRVADILNLDANVNDLAPVLREQVSWDAAWYGDGFAEIEVDGSGRPVGLQYIENRRVQVEWTGSGQTLRRKYVVQNDNGGEKVMAADQILHIPGLQFDGLTGRGIVRIARESLGHTMAIESHGATTFGNNGIPAGIIETQFQRDDDTKSRMKSSFKQNARNDIAVLDNGDKFTPLGLSNQDTQFLETRQFQVIEISRWTGVPPHLLMDMTRANYNSLELIGGEFKALTLVPWCERWRGEVRKKLFTKRERELRYDVRFNYDGFLRADRKTRYDAHAKGITSGFLTPNEARIEEGKTPLPGGDDLFTPLNMVNPNDPNADQSAGDTQPNAQEPGASDSAGGT